MRISDDHGSHKRAVRCLPGPKKSASQLIARIDGSGINRVNHPFGDRWLALEIVPELPGNIGGGDVETDQAAIVNGQYVICRAHHWSQVHAPAIPLKLRI